MVNIFMFLNVISSLLQFSAQIGNLVIYRSLKLPNGSVRRLIKAKAAAEGPTIIINHRRHTHTGTRTKRTQGKASLSGGFFLVSLARSRQPTISLLL